MGAPDLAKAIGWLGVVREGDRRLGPEFAFAFRSSEMNGSECVSFTGIKVNRE